MLYGHVLWRVLVGHLGIGTSSSAVWDPTFECFRSVSFPAVSRGGSISRVGDYQGLRETWRVKRRVAITPVTLYDCRDPSKWRRGHTNGAVVLIEKPKDGSNKTGEKRRRQRLRQQGMNLEIKRQSKHSLRRRHVSECVCADEGTAGSEFSRP